MRTSILSVALSLLFALPLAVRADVVEPLPGKTLPTAAASRTSRGVNVEAATQNPRPNFMVRVSVDRPDAIYEEGELMRVSVDSEKSGYLYLFYKLADGSTKCLFPNEYDRDNRITGGRQITLPTAGSRFQLRISRPLGDELLVALVTRQPLSAEAFGGKALTRSTVTDIDLDTLIRKGVEVELRDNPRGWAEHSVRVKTVARGVRGGKPVATKRIGLFIGISKYKDSRIRNLSICHLDAQVMAKLMKEHGRLDGFGLLVDEHATRQAIERAFQELKLKSNRGDEIFIYWSGHGATCASTDPKEPNGRDEFLVTYDGNPENIAETMVLDDTLGRWIQALDGRKVCVILDACHSAGHAEGKGGGDAGEKAAGGGGIIRTAADANSVDSLLQALAAGPANGAAAAPALGWSPLGSQADFLGGNLRRLKDIGQDDATMLFSSASDEISAERRDGKLSVMTYFVVEKMLGGSSVTLNQAYKHVSVEVPKYMKEHFPGRQQTPQLVPEGAGHDVYLR